MVYEFLLGGVLTSVLIPVLVRRRKADPDRGEAYAQRLLTLAVLALGGRRGRSRCCCAPPLTTLYASGQTPGLHRPGHDPVLPDAADDLLLPA